MDRFDLEQAHRALLADPLLSDIDKDTPLHVIKTLIAAETGGALTIRIRRPPFKTLGTLCTGTN